MARSSIFSDLGFIVSFVWVTAICCFLNQSCEPFLELPAHPTFYRYTVCKSQLKKTNVSLSKAVTYQMRFFWKTLSKLIGHLHNKLASLPRILLLITILVNHSESLLRRIALDVTIRSLMFPSSLSFY